MPPLNRPAFSPWTWSAVVANGHRVVVPVSRLERAVRPPDPVVLLAFQLSASGEPSSSNAAVLDLHRSAAEQTGTGRTPVVEPLLPRVAHDEILDLGGPDVRAGLPSIPLQIAPGRRVNPATNQPYASQEEYDRVPRYKDQTCKNSRLDELQAEKDLLARSVPPLDPKSPGSWNEKKMAKVPCSRLRQRLEAQKKLLEKRWEIQSECFGGKPDPSHENAIAEVEKAIANTKALEDKNCAPGHPMAEL